MPAPERAAPSEEFAAPAASALQDLGLTPRESAQVENPTNFARLYYNTASPSFLYRSPASHDPAKHYPILARDDFEGILANEGAGQRPILINADVDVERLPPADVWAYLEALRSWQHEGVVPDRTNPAVAPVWHLLGDEVEAHALRQDIRRELLAAQTPESILAALEKLWATFAPREAQER